MDQPYFLHPSFNTLLTPDPSAPGSPYDDHSLDWCTTSSFEEFPGALEVLRTHEVDPEPYNYNSPYPFASMQMPMSASLSTCMSKEAQVKELREDYRRQSSPDSPLTSDDPGPTMEGVRRQRERRRAQNRVAQKAYRLRKEDKIRELSAKLSEMEQEMERMEQSYQDFGTQIKALLQKIPKLETENRRLKNAP